MTQYYVKPTGADNKNGRSIGNAWLTIGKALSVIIAGDQCDVLAGTYAESVLNFTNSGNAWGDEITLRAYQTDVPKIVGNGTDAQILNIGSRSFIIIEGIDFEYQQNVIGTAQCIRGLTNSIDIIIRDCRFYDDTHGANPLDVYNAGYRVRAVQTEGDRWEIDNCEFWNVQHPIHFKINHSQGWIHGCYVHDCYQSLVIYGNNILLGTVIQDCILEASYIEDAIQCTNIDSTSFNTQGLIIKGNIIRNNNENAIDLKGTRQVWIEGNTIYGTVGSNNGPVGGWNRDAWGAITRGSGTSAKENVIRNNTFYDNAPAFRAYDGYKVFNNIFISNNRDYNGSDQNNDGHSSGGPYAYRRLGGDDHAFLNNICLNHNNFEVLANGDIAYDFDHNLYMDGAQWGDQSGAPDVYATLAAWRSFLVGLANPLSTEQNSVQVANLAAVGFVTAPSDPDLVTGDYTAFDFNLAAGSPAIDAGRWLTKANGAGVASVALTVNDARFFRGDFGNIAGVTANQIRIDGQTSNVVSVNYSTHVITLDAVATWADGDEVYLPFQGTAPEIGRYGYSGPAVIYAAATLSGVGSITATAEVVGGEIYAAATLSGIGSIIATAMVAVYGAATLSGVGSLIATAEGLGGEVYAAATLSGAASLIATPEGGTLPWVDLYLELFESSCYGATLFETGTRELTLTEKDERVLTMEVL